ncbi:hypothetical protein WJM97_23145 (plasmid) [Okeanomitos corallinicola TIOX110]|uniref:Uncharacterized protein n=1 Tax=Okeanomitos corallinicola TIOX110 TaxID=3133117 RepID=A0ABZ2V026_9CYAN
MARKSRDFKDLMQEKQSSQKKRKNLEALRNKMSEGVFGELAANMPIEPKGAIKMSEVMKDFIAPYMDSIDNLKELKAFFSLAAIAWNAAVIPESDKKEVLDAFVQQQLLVCDPETQRETREIIAELIARKRQHFSHIKRLIMDFDVTQSGQRYDISVASTLLETE